MSEQAGGDVLNDQAPADLLSELLAPLRLTGRGVWERDVASDRPVRFDEGLPMFHLVERHSAELRHDQGVISAAPGDLLLLPTGAVHAVHASREPVRMVSGSFRFEGAARSSILDSLPPVLSVSRGQGGNSEWLEPLVHFLLAESQSPAPGARIMISRLIDVLVVRTMRSWASAQRGAGRGWIGGLADPRIERALSAVHADPLRPWTVASLASVAAISRSAFAVRFAACTGEPPLRYITNWRLGLARDLLSGGGKRVSDVARAVGYESDAAFSRAFNKRFGHPPSGSRIDLRSG